MFNTTIGNIADKVEGGEVDLTVNGAKVFSVERQEGEDGARQWSVVVGNEGDGFKPYLFNMTDEVVVGEDADDIAYAQDAESGAQITFSLVTRDYLPWKG